MYYNLVEYFYGGRDVVLFKYDLHVHTMESSLCGRMYAEDIVEYYHREGYQGLAITDHFSEVFFREQPEYKKNWAALADRFLKGYRAAARRGATLGMDVILGLEFRSPDSDRDTLVFGVDEDFVYKNAYSYEMGLERFYKRFGTELLLIAAHPFRPDRQTGRPCKLLPRFIHGIEVFNGNTRHDSRNQQALDYFCAHSNIVCVSGSDAHRPLDLCTAYMKFNARIRDSAALVAALKGRDYELGL